MTREPRALLLILAILPGCSNNNSNTLNQPEKPSPLQELPVELTLAQRTRQVIPGSEQKLFIAIDDITAGQVVVSLINEDEKAIFGPHSVRPEEIQSFAFGEVEFQLQLTKLDNALIGEDYATFTIFPTQRPLTENEKIDALLETIGSMKEGTAFIRNGKEHTPEEAVEHLERKREAAGTKIQTAMEFVEHLASKSSTTGKNYEIRGPDGKILPLELVLKMKLRILESSPTDTSN